MTLLPRDDSKAGYLHYSFNKHLHNLFRCILLWIRSSVAKQIWLRAATLVGMKVARLSPRLATCDQNPPIVVRPTTFVRNRYTSFLVRAGGYLTIALRSQRAATHGRCDPISWSSPNTGHN
ncbi:hypothetical protein ABIB80_006685 [Bradyrhizobium sp. i1.15.2]